MHDILPLPSAENPLKIGARGSPLSLAQTSAIRAELANHLGIEPADIDAALPIVPIVTKGDQITDRALIEAGGKGLFTKELDEALLDGRIDCAIHSLKDVPTILPDGMAVLPAGNRADPADMLITTDGANVTGLKENCVIGSASIRRQAQLAAQRPDLRFGLLRGNVGTRLKAISSGQFTGTLLAGAGLSRLGLLGEKVGDDVWTVALEDGDPLFARRLDPNIFPPSAGQGFLAVTIKSENKALLGCWAGLCDVHQRDIMAVERAALAFLDGSCRTAMGIYAQWIEQALKLNVEIFDAVGSQKRATEILFSGEELSGDWQDKLAKGLAPFKSS